MLDPVVSEIEWSTDTYSLEKVVDELFHLPQVVKVKCVSPSLEKLKDLHDNDLLVLSSSRKIDIIRATDSLMNEYYIPLDSAAKVEVVGWSGYKTFYDHVEELHEASPTHILVEEDDENIGINKGEVLKLGQKISLRGSMYLQCNVQGRPDVEVNIPFSHKGVRFKTLGEFTEPNVLLTEVVRKCKLPIHVKFVDNKLKMKKVDGSSRYPMGLYNIVGSVKLHDVMRYADIVGKRISHPDKHDVITVPEDCHLDVFVPTAATRSNSKYVRFCNRIAHEIGPEMLRNLGIEHNHWVIFQEDQGPPSPKQHESPKPVPKKRTYINKISITQTLDQHHYTSSLTSKAETEYESSSLSKSDSGFTPTPARKNSNTFPRFLTPSQMNDFTGSNQEIYQRIHVLSAFQETFNQETKPVMLRANTFGRSRILDEEDSLYVPMKSNVVTESMVQEERKMKNAWQSNANLSQVSGSKLEMLKNRPKPPLPTEIRKPDQASSNLKHSAPKYDVVPKLSVNADRRNVDVPKKREYTDKPINDWSEKDVSKFLKSIGLEKYVKSFSEKKVDGKALVKLNETELVKSFKMSNKSHLMTLLKFKAECMKHEVQNEYLTVR